MRRRNFNGGIPVPVLRQAGNRVPRQALLYVRRQVRRLVARVPGRGLVELGRLSELEAGSAGGDRLVRGPASRYVNGSEWCWGMWRGGYFLEDWWGNGATAADLGTYSWNETAIAGGATLSKAAGAGSPVGWADAGILRITTGGSSGDGAIIGLNPAGAAPLYGAVPTGAWLTSKVALSAGATNLEAFTGIANGMSSAHFPDSAGSNSVNFIGFVARPAGSAVNWFGVCRTGTSETTLDLGVLANATARMLAWEKTAAGVRFWADPSSPIGTITTNIPALKAIPVLGIKTSGAAARALDQDLIGIRWGGRRI